MLLLTEFLNFTFEIEGENNFTYFYHYYYIITYMCIASRHKYNQPVYQNAIARSSFMVCKYLNMHAYLRTYVHQYAYVLHNTNSLTNYVHTYHVVKLSLVVKYFGGYVATGALVEEDTY